MPVSSSTGTRRPRPLVGRRAGAPPRLRSWVRPLPAAVDAQKVLARAALGTAGNDAGFGDGARCGVADDGGQVAAGPGQQFQELVAVGVSPNRTDRDRRRAQGGEVGDRVRGATGAVLFAIEGEDHHGVRARDPAEVPDEVVVEPEAPTTTTRSPPKKSSGRASRGDAASPRRSRGLRVGPSSPARPQWGPRARSRWTAALMRARWVNAWGKLPSASPEGPTSSA